MSDLWNAKTYSKFCEPRTRPARDLLNAISSSFQPKIVCDLGCGPGNSTVLLKNRWPEARIIGLDTSINMLEEAKRIAPQLEFLQTDIAQFSEKTDCLFANASLHWLNNHEYLIPKLLKLINPGGVFAIQMPNNFHAPSHQVIIKVLKTKRRWCNYVKNLHYGMLSEPLYKLSYYYDLLTQHGASSLQLWETEYFQEMQSYQEIFNWVKGTVLRPILSVMNIDNQTEFEKEYLEEIIKKYPSQTNKNILFPFKRIFMVVNV